MFQNICLEEGVNHLVSIMLFADPYRTYSPISQWTLSALQLHPCALIVVDEDATAGNVVLIFTMIIKLT